MGCLASTVSSWASAEHGHTVSSSEYKLRADRSEVLSVSTESPSALALFAIRDRLDPQNVAGQTPNPVNLSIREILTACGWDGFWTGFCFFSQPFFPIRGIDEEVRSNSTRPPLRMWQLITSG